MRAARPVRITASAPPDPDPIDRHHSPAKHWRHRRGAIRRGGKAMFRRLVPSVLLALACALVIGAAAPVAGALTRDAQLKQNVRLLQVYVERYAAGKGFTYPAASVVRRGGGLTAPVWPANPWTGRPMAPGTARGAYTYTLAAGGASYTLTGHLSSGAFTVTGAAPSWLAAERAASRGGSRRCPRRDRLRPGGRRRRQARARIGLGGARDGSVCPRPQERAAGDDDHPVEHHAGPAEHHAGRVGDRPGSFGDRRAGAGCCPGRRHRREAGAGCCPGQRR